MDGRWINVCFGWNHGQCCKMVLEHSFDASKFIVGENVIKISSGSLNDLDRIFNVEMSKTLESDEIPI